MRSQYKRKLADYVDSVVGDIVDELVNKYYSDKIEGYQDYEKLLYNIAREIKNEVLRGKGTINDIVVYLESLRSKRNVANLILSYLIGKILNKEE
ncbi:MAG: hypothetical protein ACO2OR_05270 [Desulfurococcaceae archaeon]